VVAVPRAIGKSVPRRIKIVLLFLSRPAAPRRILSFVVLVVPALPVAVASRGPRLLSLLLLLPLLGLSPWLMKKRKRWTVPDAPLLFHRIAPRLEVR